MKDLQIEEAGDQELQKAVMEAKRAENMIKYKDEIANRPKAVWLKNEKQKKDIKDRSKEDLKNISKRFDEQISRQHKEAQQRSRNKKRDEKAKQKQKPLPGESKFEMDREQGKKGASDATTPN